MNPADPPEQCPDCSSRRLARICYGLVHIDEEVRRALDEGRIVLGGCCFSDRSRTWRCLDCGREGGRFDTSDWPRPEPRPWWWVVPLLIFAGCMAAGSCILGGIAYATLDHPRVGLAIVMGLYVGLIVIPIAVARWRMRPKAAPPTPAPDVPEADG